MNEPAAPQEDAVVLTPWQLAAVDAWEQGLRKPFEGTLEVFTGG